MLSVVKGVEPSTALRDPAHVFAPMWRDRKRVFVDQLGWQVPVIDDAFEIDQFDTARAVYLLVTDRARERHLASVRLLSTAEPHILGDLFPELCIGSPPRQAATWEITRLCMSPDLTSARQSLLIRRELAIGLLEYGLANGIERYVQVHLASHLPQIAAAGWDVTPLGMPRTRDGQLLMASRIRVDAAALAAVRGASGVKQPLFRPAEREPLRAAA